MTWRKDGLLLAIGGLAGLVLAAVLESSDEDSEVVQETDALESLIGDIRKDAEWAMAECSTDEEREKVYAQVKESVPLLNPCVVAGNDVVVPQLFCLLVENVELKIPVTSDARIRCLAVFVTAYKRLNDLLPKLSLIVIDVIRDSDSLTYCSRVLSIIQATACAEQILANNIVLI